MKRSEMIDRIHQELVYSRKPMHGIRITDSPADIKLAERILEVQEEAGMLPPQKKKSLIEVNFNGERDILHQMWDFSWEPEDEL